MRAVQAWRVLGLNPDPASVSSPMSESQLAVVEGFAHAFQAMMAPPSAELESRVCALEASAEKYKRRCERVKEAVAQEKASLLQRLADEQKTQEEAEASLRAQQEEAQKEKRRAADEAREQEHRENTEFFRSLFTLMSPDLAERKGVGAIRRGATARHSRG